MEGNLTAMGGFHVHILGICGYTTSGLALMAKDLGYRVTGSDENAYPPATEILDQNGIEWSNYYSADNLSKFGPIDLTIQSNNVQPGNLELTAARRSNLKIISDSEYFYELTRERRRIVVCGTHGKTTTAALVAWILEVNGRNPGFRLGTVANDFGSSVRLGRGEEFVFEGDEYVTTFSDARPKYYHFHPNIAIINNIDWDHPDVYSSRIAYANSFRKYLVDCLSPEAFLIANAEDKNVEKVISRSPSKIIRFGMRKGDFFVSDEIFSASGCEFTVRENKKILGRFRTKLSGQHNIRNCLAAISLSRVLNIPVEKIQTAVASFKGTRRRFERIGEARGVTVIDDYAHNPVKVHETIKAATLSYPQGRVFAVFVPHTFTRTKFLLPDYRKAFGGANYVLVADIEPARERKLKGLTSSAELAEAIRGIQGNVFYLPRSEDIINYVVEQAKSGDVVLCMSVGGFDNLAGKLFDRLKFFGGLKVKE